MQLGRWRWGWWRSLQRDSWAWRIMKRTRTRTVGPRTQHAWTGSQEQAASHSKNTASMYVAMLVISVTKASIWLCRDRRRCADQSGGIYNSDSTVALGIYDNVNRPCPRASPSDSGRFTAINPYHPCYNYYLVNSACYYFT